VRLSQGNPSVGGVKHNSGSRIEIFDLLNAISQKRCKIGAKFVLTTNRKSHMSFRLVPNLYVVNKGLIKCCCTFWSKSSLVDYKMGTARIMKVVVTEPQTA